MWPVLAKLKQSVNQPTKKLISNYFNNQLIIKAMTPTVYWFQLLQREYFSHAKAMKGIFFIFLIINRSTVVQKSWND